MRTVGLRDREIALMRAVFSEHSEIAEVRLFGSRAKGTHAEHSDVDLALWGNLDSLRAKSIQAELDELPLPYQFDVLDYHSIQHNELREHIDRVGRTLYLCADESLSG